MSADNIIKSIALLISGGAITSIANYFFDSIKNKENSKNNFKETRYKAIILLCYSLVNYEKEKTMLIINRPDINSIDRLKNELHVEFINMSLFGSDKVVIKMKEFVIHGNKTALIDLALEMRKDLYGIKTKLNHNDFDINF